MMFGKKTQLEEKILEYMYVCMYSLGGFTLFVIHCYSHLHGKTSL